MSKITEVQNTTDQHISQILIALQQLKTLPCRLRAVLSELGVGGRRKQLVGLAGWVLCPLVSAAVVWRREAAETVFPSAAAGLPSSFDRTVGAWWLVARGWWLVARGG